MELEVEALARHFGAVRAVDGVSFSVAAGEVVGLLGPNGAGKTSTLRMIAGILPPTAGRVRVAGRDLAEDPRAAKRRVGFLSGDTQLYRRLTPRELLLYFGRLYELEPAALRARVELLVAELDMGPFAGRLCGTLSSGQKQRVNIARAFLHDPTVLVLDEPTAMLDVISGRFIVEAIRRERARGRAVLFSTHLMGEAEHLCDRVILLHQGRVVESGTIPDLLARTACRNLTDAFLHQVGRTPVE